MEAEIPVKLWYLSTRLHVTSQKTIIVIWTAVLLPYQLCADMHQLNGIMPVHLWSLSSMLSCFGSWISNNSISLFHLSLVRVREIRDRVKQKFVVNSKCFLNVVSWWNVSVRSRTLEAPFPYNNYVCKSLCIVWLINSGLTAVRVMCLFLHNSGSKWLLTIVAKEFLLLGKI